MSAYFFAFALSTLLCLTGDHYRKIGKRRRSLMFFPLAVLVVSILAGLRDLNIGTDIWTYGEYSFMSARQSANIIQYFQDQSMLDPVYNLLTYMVSRCTDNSHWLYFFVGLFIYSFTMMGVLNYEDRISPTIAWMCFLFLYYGDTLNAMRQFMGVAVAFYGMKFAQEGRYKKYLLVTFFAVMCHDTAIISLPITAVLIILKRSDTLLVKTLIILGSLACCVFYSYFTGLLARFGIIDVKYMRYMSVDFSLALNPLILRLPFFLFILLFYKSFCNGERTGVLKKLSGPYEGDFLVIMLILEIIISQMRAVMPALYRLSFMFGMYRMVAYSRVASAVKKNNRMVIVALLLVYLIVLWIYQNVIQGNNQIYPFTSRILGIS